MKSLLSFAHRTGLIPVNAAAAAVVTPKPKDTLSQKILSELEVLTMIALEPCVRKPSKRITIQDLPAQLVELSEKDLQQIVGGFAFGGSGGWEDR